MLALGFAAAVLAAPYLLDWLGKRYFGMRGKELSAYLFDRLVAFACQLLQALALVLRLLGLKKAA